jgi:hypothetical protein
MYFPCGIRGRGMSAVLTLDPWSKAYQAGHRSICQLKGFIE